MANIRKPPPTPAVRTPHTEPSWDDMFFFRAIAETGSLTKAAKRLNTTQPTVSKHLDSLEARLGVVLVTRSLSGIELTEAGRAVARQAQTMGRCVDQLWQEVGQRDRLAAGKVRIVCPDALASYVLAPSLAPFQRAFPDIAIELRHRGDPVVPTDLAIQFHEAKRMDDVAIPLGWQHYAAFAVQDYIDLYQAPHTLADALQHKMLVHLDHVHQLEHWRQKIKPLQEMLDPVLTTDCGNFMIRAVLGGAGVAALPTYLAHFEPALIMVGDGEYARARFWLVCRHDELERKRIRVAVDWIKELFSPSRNPWFREAFVEPSEFGAALGGSE